jgi:hypothetical protein
MPTVTLSTLITDFAGIRLQLQEALASETSWSDLLVSSTGQTILDFFAAIGTYDQYSIERALQEGFLESAQSDISIFTLARLLGVRLTRNVSSNVTATLNNPNGSAACTIPAYTQFIVNSTCYFINTAPIVFNIGVTSLSVILTEGQAVTSTYYSTGDEFQEYTVGNNFTASDSLTRVQVNGIDWTKNTLGLWQLGPNDNSYYELTTQSGQVEIMFGNNINGAIPSSGSEIDIITYIVQGSSINTSLTGLTITSPSISNLSGVTTSGITGGYNAPTSTIYKFLTPRLYASGNRCVTRGDYEGTVLTYPGVIDVKAVGEQDVNPGNSAWQNCIGLVILSTVPWLTVDITNFTNWINSYIVGQCYILVIVPTPISLAVTIDALVSTSYSIATVNANITAAIATLFTPSQGVLGKSIYPSDIYNAVMAVAGVTKATISTPTGITTALYNQYINLGDFTLTTEYGS